jgi:hypothetical protein
LVGKVNKGKRERERTQVQAKSAKTQRGSTKGAKEHLQLVVEIIYVERELPLSIIYLLCAVFMFLKHDFHSNDNHRRQFSIQISQRVNKYPMVFKVLTKPNNHLKIGLHSNNHLTLVNISVVHVNGLGLTHSVNFIMKFI